MALMQRNAWIDRATASETRSDC